MKKLQEPIHKLCSHTGEGKVCQNTDFVREVAWILHSKSAPNGGGRGIKNLQNCTRGIIHACPLILFSALALLLTCFCLDVSGRGDDLRRAGELVGGERAERPPGEPPRRVALGLRARRRVRHVLGKRPRSLVLHRFSWLARFQVAILYRVTIQDGKNLLLSQFRYFQQLVGSNCSYLLS